MQRPASGRENMGVCLSQELVERYISGSCSADERTVVETHIGQCDKCRELIESARSKGARAESAGAGDKAGDRAGEETQILQDDYPTEAVTQTSGPPRGQGDFAQSLGAMIEGYEIVEEMPRGGQAVVYKAFHTATKTNVAIKVLLPTLLASERARYYFEREAELIASLDHPNIVSIRDSGIIHRQYYFVMQYIDGQPLDRYVREEKLSFRRRVELFIKVCGAITYAHQQGVIHRDLKFANILVDKRGEPHILDFGLAKAVGLSEQAGDNALATMTGQWAGSLSTMSPEQSAGKPDLIDVRTDVYSLGVILYHMLTGQYPYDVHGSTLEVLGNIQKVEPVRPRQVIRKFDSDVEAILLTALAKERSERYQSTAELQSDIENWLEGRPIRVKSISSIYLLRKIIARHRYTSTVAALLMLIVIGFVLTIVDLYISEKKAKKDLNTIADQWAKEARRVPLLTRRLIFGSFLQAWEDDNNREAARLAGKLFIVPRDSKEKKAAIFLLDPNSAAEKESDFRESLSSDPTGFADFVIGEHHLKIGNHEEALKAYRNSYDTLVQLRQCNSHLFDDWLYALVRSRLYKLTAGEAAEQESENQKAKNEKTMEIKKDDT